MALALVWTPAAAQETVAEMASEPLTIRQSWEPKWNLELSRGGSAELVWVDSMLFVASLDRNVHAVLTRPEPRVVWKENFKGGFEARPVVTEDRIYLAETLRGGRLVALDRRTRDVLWATKAGDLVAPPLITDDRIIVVTSEGEVHSFEDNGALVWSTELETRVVSAPLLLDGRIVVAASDGMLYSLDPTTGDPVESTDPGAGPIWGQPVVSETAAGTTALFATIEGQVLEVTGDLEIVQRRSFPSRFYAGPEANGDRLYLIGHEGTLWSYDWPAAEILWQTRLDGTFRAPPTRGDDYVAVGNLAGRFYVVDAQAGRVEFATDLDSAITSKSLARDRDLFVLTERGTMYAFSRPTVGSDASQ